MLFLTIETYLYYRTSHHEKIIIESIHYIMIPLRIKIVSELIGLANTTQFDHT
jgi:hypothetical protein